MKVGVIGINHKSADLILREKLARACQKRFGLENSHHGLFSYILLSTCNRTEIYFHSEDLSITHTLLLSILRFEINEEFEHKIYSYFGADCFYHLARVTAGVDSAIVGETEIQGQVKQSYEVAAKNRFLSHELHFLFQKSLKVGKEVRSTVNLDLGFPALDEAILHAAQGLLGNLENLRILFVGISSINDKLFHRFQNKGLKNIVFCNRTKEKAEKYQQKEQIALLNWENLDEWVHYDLTIFATKSSHFLLTRKHTFKTDDKKRLIIDLSVPRNVDPQITRCPKIFLLNVDQLNRDRKRKEKVFQIAKIERQIIAKAVETQINIFQMKERSRKSRILCVS